MFFLDMKKLVCIIVWIGFFFYLNLIRSVSVVLGYRFVVWLGMMNRVLLWWFWIVGCWWLSYYFVLVSWRWFGYSFCWLGFVFIFWLFRVGFCCVGWYVCWLVGSCFVFFWVLGLSWCCSWSLDGYWCRIVLIGCLIWWRVFRLVRLWWCFWVYWIIGCWVVGIVWGWVFCWFCCCWLDCVDNVCWYRCSLWWMLDCGLGLLLFWVWCFVRLC